MCNSVCGDLSRLKQLKDAPVDAATFDPYIEHCSRMFQSEMQMTSQCQSVCSTIPSGDCAKYADHCTCHGRYEESGGYEHCACNTREEYKDQCELQKDDTCPAGCTMIPGILEARDGVMTEARELAAQTADSMISSLWQMQQVPFVRLEYNS